MRRFGEYVVYVDESGDHNLTTPTDDYPVFVFAFCIFRIDDYVDHVVPAVQRLKFEHFGHDMVILHEREIRKSLPPFNILLNATVRESFLPRLSEIVRDSAFRVVAVVIDKKPFVERLGVDANPYHVALEYGLERVFFQLQDRGQVGRRVHTVFESRGAREDATLRAEFDRICRTTKLRGFRETVEFRCAPKGANSSGLQIADMIARPIGLHALRPEQNNRAWNEIESNMARSADGRMEGYGLKIYPTAQRRA